jgi:hypothetical protein
VTRPLDEISRTDLDEILDRYADVVDPATRAALEQLVDDLKKSVTDLENELSRLIDDFGAQADTAADFATAAARQTGWNPDDPSGYALGASDVPWVEVPDISDVPGAFSSEDNPYAAYADAVIAALEADVDGGQVVERAGFVASVRAWRANSVALKIALRDRRLGRARPIPRRHPPAGDRRPGVEVPPRGRCPPPRARTGRRGHTFALAGHPVAPCTCARTRPTPPQAPLGRAPARWEAPRWAA